MTKARWIFLVTAVLLLSTSAIAISALDLDHVDQKAAAAVIQYKLVPVPSVMTQAQFQSVLTTQGNGGWRFAGPYAVGTPPIPTQTVLMFSKP